MVFFCDVLLLHSYPSFGVESFCQEIERRADRAVDVLGQARKSRVVVVSWCDSTGTGRWEEKAKILRPLRRLKEKNKDIIFRIGKVNGPEDLEREDFVKALRDVLGAEERIEAGYDGTDDPSSSLRMLAFDVRQDRRLLSSQPGFPMSTRTMRSGWKGAPPSLEAPLEDEKET